ncbi:hypothetical protein B6U67_04555 [Methanosarcinales archaeon ex4484_138]|nr:MAG: hypothetical protein B6U67_04555 [Methanosarcinales archaeon ex4484_138]
MKTDYGTGTINIEYDPSVVHVTGVFNGSESTVVAENIDNVIGVVKISAWNIYGISGDIDFADVEFTVVGSSTDSTPLNLDIAVLKDISYKAKSSVANTSTPHAPQKIIQHPI